MAAGDASGQTVGGSRDRRPLLIAVSIVIVAGAGLVWAMTTSNPIDRISLSSADVTRATELVEYIRGYEAAWDNHDLEAFAAFLSEDDFLFDEPGTHLETKALFVAFMKPYITDPEHVGAIDRRFHVGSGELVETYRTWGFAGRTESDPVVQVDLFKVSGDRITAIRALYGADLLRQFLNLDPTDAIGRYVAAWSSRDPTGVGALYTENATRTEALYGVELTGQADIRTNAADFFQRHPGVTPTVIEPYIFGDSGTAGVTLALVSSGGCALEYTVLLETDATGAITSERVYYDIEMIEACAWER